MATDVGDTAKLFMHGRSQAVRLPKAYRFVGAEVRIRRVGAAVVLEPIGVEFDVASWRAQVAALADMSFFEHGREQPGWPSGDDAPPPLD